MGIAAPLVSAAVGAVLGAWCVVVFTRRDSRREAALQLLERYMAPEFWAARAQTWKLMTAWEEGGDLTFVKYFVESFHSDTEKQDPNGLTPHQNLSWVLHFFVSLQLSYEAGLLDGRMMTTLFAPHYAFYLGFFTAFRDEYRQRLPAGEVEPPWLAILPRLEATFGKYGAGLQTASREFDE